MNPIEIVKRIPRCCYFMIMVAMFGLQIAITYLADGDEPMIQIRQNLWILKTGRDG